MICVKSKERREGALIIGEGVCKQGARSAVSMQAHIGIVSVECMQGMEYYE